jgi:hypothetical protein
MIMRSAPALFAGFAIHARRLVFFTNRWCVAPPIRRRTAVSRCCGGHAIIRAEAADADA